MDVQKIHRGFLHVRAEPGFRVHTAYTLNRFSSDTDTTSGAVCSWAALTVCVRAVFPLHLCIKACRTPFSFSEDTTMALDSSARGRIQAAAAADLAGLPDLNLMAATLRREVLRRTRVMIFRR